MTIIRHVDFVDNLNRHCQFDTGHCNECIDNWSSNVRHWNFGNDVCKEPLACLGELRHAVFQTCTGRHSCCKQGYRSIYHNLNKHACIFVALGSTTPDKCHCKLDKFLETFLSFQRLRFMTRASNSMKLTSNGTNTSFPTRPLSSLSLQLSRVTTIT
jgi:hypothetical protein